MTQKIQMTTPLVEIDGDEMTRLLWPIVKEKLILPFVDLKTEYYDLGIKERDASDDRVTGEAAEALRLIAAAIEGANRHGRPTGICGGLASDVEAAPLLVGLGAGVVLWHTRATIERGVAAFFVVSVVTLLAGLRTEIEATPRGFVLRPLDGSDVVLLVPPIDGEEACFLSEICSRVVFANHKPEQISHLLQELKSLV